MNYELCLEFGKKKPSRQLDLHFSKLYNINGDHRVASRTSWRATF